MKKILINILFLSILLTACNNLHEEINNLKQTTKKSKTSSNMTSYTSNEKHITSTQKVYSKSKLSYIEIGKLEEKLFQRLSFTRFSQFSSISIKNQTVNNYILLAYKELFEGIECSTFMNIFKFIDFNTANYDFMNCYKYDNSREEFHMGIEINCQILTDIYAPAYGNVVLCDELKTTESSIIIIQHNYDFFKGYTLFSGITNVNVKTGDNITPKIIIGQTKYNSLFFGVFNNNFGFVNPIDYLVSNQENIKNERNYTNEIEKKLSEDSHISFSWPISNPQISSRFGFREDPFDPGNVEFHTGIDLINNNTNSPIHAIASGIVVATYSNHPTNGNAIVIRHFNSGYISKYCHLRMVKVKKGEHIGINKTIGIMGSSGRSTGPHLHLTVMKNDKTIDPEKILPKVTQFMARKQL